MIIINYQLLALYAVAARFAVVRVGGATFPIGWLHGGLGVSQTNCHAAAH